MIELSRFSEIYLLDSLSGVHQDTRNVAIGAFSCMNPPTHDLEPRAKQA
jgi:hypothetical protein